LGPSSPTAPAENDADSAINPDPDWPRNKNGMAAWTGAILWPSNNATWPPADAGPDPTGTAWAFSRTDWGFARTIFDLGSTFSQCPEIWVRADGQSYDSGIDTVNSVDPFEGTVTLPTPAVFVTFGVRYRQVMETLDIGFNPQSGQTDMTMSTRTVRKVGLEVSNTSPGFLLGDIPEGDLSPWYPEPGDENTAEFGPSTEDLTYSGLVHSSVATSWNRHGRICVVNERPFPITISAIVREVEYGGT
jgi:hypothetical protein